MFIHFWLCWVFIASFMAFCSSSEQGLLSTCSALAFYCGNFSCFGAWILEHRLSSCVLEHTALVGLRHVGYSWTRDRTCCPLLWQTDPTTGSPEKSGVFFTVCFPISSLGKGSSSLPFFSHSGSSLQMALPTQATQTVRSPVKAAVVAALSQSLLAISFYA